MGFCLCFEAKRVGVYIYGFVGKREKKELDTRPRRKLGLSRNYYAFGGDPSDALDFLLQQNQMWLVGVVIVVNTRLATQLPPDSLVVSVCLLTEPNWTRNYRSQSKCLKSKL